jgi:hypothetical protein
MPSVLPPKPGAAGARRGEGEEKGLLQAVAPGSGSGGVALTGEDVAWWLARGRATTVERGCGFGSECADSWLEALRAGIGRGLGDVDPAGSSADEVDLGRPTASGGTVAAWRRCAHVVETCRRTTLWMVAAGGS